MFSVGSTIGGFSFDVNAKSVNSDTFLVLESLHFSQALTHQEKAVMSSERLRGIDHPQTIHDYVSPINPQTGNILINPSSLITVMYSLVQTHLALYCFAGGRCSTALQLLYRARYLTLMVSGEDHPHIITLDVRETADPGSKADNMLKDLTTFQNHPALMSLFSSPSEHARPRSSGTHGARAVTDVPEECFHFNLAIPRAHFLTGRTLVRVCSLIFAFRSKLKQPELKFSFCLPLFCMQSSSPRYCVCE